jgi:hypothetical protein
VKKCLQHILVLIAAITVVAHSTVPHHHFGQEEVYEHHDDSNNDNHHHDSDNDHNIFSVAQLDNNFIPVKSQASGFEPAIVSHLTEVIVYHFNILLKQEKLIFGYYEEFPPPTDLSSNLPSRAPPTIVVA